VSKDALKSDATLVIVELLVQSFGIYLWLLVVMLRFHILYVIFDRKDTITYRTYLYPTLIIYVPVALFNLLAALNYKEWAYYWSDEISSYRAKGVTIFVNLTFVTLNIGLIAYYNIKLRNVIPLFNEFKETNVGVACLISHVTFTIISVFLSAGDKIWYKTCVLSLYTIIFDIFFWIIMYRPLMDCLRDRDAAMKKFFKDTYAVKLYDACMDTIDFNTLTDSSTKISNSDSGKLSNFESIRV